MRMHTPCDLYAPYTESSMAQSRIAHFVRLRAIAHAYTSVAVIAFFELPILPTITIYYTPPAGDSVCAELLQAAARMMRTIDDHNLNIYYSIYDLFFFSLRALVCIEYLVPSVECSFTRDATRKLRALLLLLLLMMMM